MHLPIIPSENQPKYRKDCLPGGFNAKRPCPWETCRWHLPMVREEARFTCVLDAADQGGMGLDEVGDLLGLTIERVKIIEAVATRKLSKIEERFPGQEGLSEFTDGIYQPEGWRF